MPLGVGDLLVEQRGLLALACREPGLQLPRRLQLIRRGGGQRSIGRECGNRIAQLAGQPLQHQYSANRLLGRRRHRQQRLGRIQREPFG